MTNYEIKIQVDIITTEQDITPNTTPSADGNFRIVIGRESGQSIDHCEQASVDRKVCDQLLGKYTATTR